jgi:DNA-binding CsgD family transcriptional regulator
LDIRQNIDKEGAVSETMAGDGVEERRASYRVKEARRPPADAPAPADVRWSTPENAKRAFQGFAEESGFPFFHLSLCMAPTPQHAPVPSYITTYPQPWLQHYCRNGYVRLDPTLALLRTAIAPFAWHEIERRNLETQAFFEAAARHGLVDGFTLALRAGNDESVALTLAGAEVPREVDQRWPLYTAAYAFLSAAVAPLRQLTARVCQQDPAELLTEKQRQIMILLMQGHGVKAIARRLNIHSRTVDDGLRRACARLGARSREQAIVRALASRQVEMSACTPAEPVGQPASPRRRSDAG